MLVVLPLFAGTEDQRESMADLGRIKVLSANDTLCIMKGTSAPPIE